MRPRRANSAISAVRPRTGPLRKALLRHTLVQMSGEDVSGRGAVALVQQVFDAFAARDHDALVDVFDNEIEFFGPTATVLNEGKCYRGHDGIRRYLQDAEALWAQLDLMPQ